MRHGRRTWAVALGLALATAGVACGNSGNHAKPEDATTAPAAAPRPAGAVAAGGATVGGPAADAEQSQSILSVLTVEHEVDVPTQRDGVVEAVDAEEGSRVRQDQVLAHLDDRVQRAQLAHDQDDLVVAKDNVEYYGAELRAKQANFRRYQELRKLGLGSEADLEKARFEAEGAQYDLDSWKAIVQRTATQIRMAELELAKMDIRAPFDGVIARRFIRTGQTLAKGDRCFLVTQLRPLRVRFPVSETSPHAPRVGDRVMVSLGSDPARIFPARVIRVGPVVDPASGSWDVLAQLDGRMPEDLRPGMAVEVHWPPAAHGTRR